MRAVEAAYLSHPFGGNAALLARAKRWYRWAITQGEVVILADWILSCEVLPDTKENIALGLRADRELIRRCDEMWLVGGVDDFRRSVGMAAEVEFARQYDVKIIDLLHLGPEPPG